MPDQLDNAIADLENTDAGWVTRRDAAQAVAAIVAKGIESLSAHAADADRDVRDVITEALGNTRAALDGVQPVAQERPYSLEELVKFVEKPGSREVEPAGEGYDITVFLNEGRKQIVHVRPGASQSGANAVHVTTRCGPAPGKALKWALRNNVGLTHCAMALTADGEQEYLEMVSAFLANAVTPEEFKACVKEIAFYGDWAEEQLTKSDQF